MQESSHGSLKLHRIHGHSHVPVAIPVPVPPAPVPISVPVPAPVHVHLIVLHVWLSDGSWMRLWIGEDDSLVVCAIPRMDLIADRTV